MTFHHIDRRALRPGFASAADGKRAAHRRRGFTVMELGLALALLAVFLGVFVPVLAGITRERRVAAQEQAALQHAANLLDELTRRPAGEWTRSAPPELVEQLPGVEQSIQTAVDEASAAMRITVTVRWQTGKETRSRPMVLSAWAPAGGAP